MEDGGSIGGGFFFFFFSFGQGEDILILYPHRTRAAQRPLYLAPDDETDRGQGRDFLYEFEARKAAGHGNDGEAKDGTNFDGGMDGKESSSR